jgi:hypothetical protein
MIFGFDDSSIVDKSGRSESTHGTDGTRGSKLFILTKSVLKTVALLLENLKFSPEIIRQRNGRMNLLNNSRASISANSSHKGIDSRITLYDCFIGGAVTVGLSAVVIQLTFFIWNRFIALNLRSRRKKIQDNIDQDISNPYKTNEVKPCHNDKVLDDLSVNGDQDQKRAELDVTVCDCTNTFIRGSCQCRAVQFLLCQKEWKRVPFEDKKLVSRAPAIDFDSAWKISFPKVSVHSASQHFELNPSSIPFFRNYHVPPTTGGTHWNQNRIINAAHAFCSICGVPILYAPDSATDVIELNYRCLERDICEEQDAAIAQEGAYHNVWKESITAQDYYQYEENWTPCDDDRTPYHPKAATTPLTEVTTITTASTAESTRTTVNDGSTNGSLDSDYSLCTFLFDNGVNNVTTSGRNVSDWQGCSSQNHLKNSTTLRWGNTSSGNDAEATPKISTNLSRLHSTSTASLWKKYKRKSLIDSPVKQNLMHYMKKHLKYTDPEEAETSELVDQVER